MRKLLFLLLVIASVAKQSSGQHTKLYDFAGLPDGSSPYGDLFYDGTFLYGMTNAGGPQDFGTIFKIKPDGTAYVKLFDFDIPIGYHPYGNLISDGTYLYGMTYDGGINSDGVIFRIMPDGSAYSRILDFSNDTLHGYSPYGSLIFDGTYLYGMTNVGGINHIGVLFKIKPDGTGYAKLLDFAGSSNGSYPIGSLISDGTFLYGMTTYGGANDIGTIYKIKKDGTGYSKLLDFTDPANGSSPYGSLVSDGTFLYGMASGGTNGFGVIFRIMPDGTGFNKLHDFDLALNGYDPIASLIFDGTSLYGMTRGGGINSAGVVFKIKPDGTGYTKLYDFLGGPGGTEPRGSLVSDGTCMYGMTDYGGTYDYGTIFKYCIENGIEELNTQASIHISPNPFSNTLTLSGTTAKGEAVLYDVLGNELLRIQTTAGETRLNTERLAAGFYLLSYMDGERRENVKVVKEDVH